MPVNFDQSRWNRVRETYETWWKGELDRPVIPVVTTPSGRNPSRYGFGAHGRRTFSDLSVSAGEIIDSIDTEFSDAIFLGDSFPMVNMSCSGAGIIAAMMGAELKYAPDENTTWFRWDKDIPPGDLHFEYDPENVWLQRIKDICSAGIERWRGQALIGMPDLGGAVDILSSFRPGDKMLLDLYDEPEEIKRLIREIHDIWHSVYREIDSVLKPLNPGYTAWAGIYSERTYYMLQCDFAYMIGPEMFDEFVKPELQESCEILENPFFHLDGIGQLPHLDSLLQMEKLKGIQWIPGAGQPGMKDWPEVYRKIKGAGKLIQLGGNLPTLEAVSEQIGTSGGIQLMTITGGDPEELSRLLKSHGVPPE